jgi:RimJ/RimL family protein N-acetyltransferase
MVVRASHAGGVARAGGGVRWPELGVQQVALDTWSFNTAAQAFFAWCGYEIYNVRLRRRLPSSRRADGL